MIWGVRRAFLKMRELEALSPNMQSRGREYDHFAMVVHVVQVMEVLKWTLGRTLEVRMTALGLHETSVQLVGADLLHGLLFLKVC